MKKADVLKSINIPIQERLFTAIKKMYIHNHRERFKKTEDFRSTKDQMEMRSKMDAFQKKAYKNSESFYLSLYSIYALYLLYLREEQIKEFESQEIVRIKANYRYNDIEFSAVYKTPFRSDMQKEIEDTLADLRNPKYKHIVSNYVPIKDASRAPHHPLTNAELKYSGYYLFNFLPDRTTKLANLLYRAKLITNPETDGWYIDDEFAEEMITILNQKYKEEEVLQHKRKFIDNKLDRSKHTITPTKLNDKYFPKKIMNTPEFRSINFEDVSDAADAIKLYEFIFYITLATQMKDSIYDRSEIEITVGNRILREEANYLIEGQDNWEKLTGALIKRLNESTKSEQGVVVLPNNIKVGEVLLPIEIYPFTYNTRRPQRYGVGRFVKEILEKNNIGSNSEHDDIVRNLIDTKATLEIQNILYPQEIAMFALRWIIEYIPSFVDIEYLRELELKIDSVVDGNLSLESVIKEINMLIDGGFKMSDYNEEDNRPSESKIKLVKAIAAKNGVRLSDDIFSSTAKCDIFLSKYPETEPIKVGNCPECNSLVYQKEWVDQSGEVLAYYACENFKRVGGCSFSLWDNYIKKFFSQKALELHSIDERRDALKKILSKKRGYLFTGFLSKAQKPYDANVFLVQVNNKNTGNKEWIFDLKFINNRTRT